jgi:hypothetical protein
VRLAGVLFLFSALALGCRDKTSSEYVADQFADAYFRRFDQESALAYTALGATDMLDKELADTKALRETGYTPAEAAANVSYVRGDATPRGARVDYHYVITAHEDETAPVVREADVELAKIGGGWKVVTLHFVK